MPVSKNRRKNGTTKSGKTNRLSLDNPINLRLNSLSRTDCPQGMKNLLQQNPRDVVVQCLIRDWQIKPITTEMVGKSINIASLRLSQISRIAEAFYGRGALMLDVADNAIGFVPLTSLTEQQHGLRLILNSYNLEEEFLFFDPHIAMEFYNPEQKRTITKARIFSVNSNVDVTGVAINPKQ
jgi:hypothetical protein